MATLSRMMLDSQARQMSVSRTSTKTSQSRSRASVETWGRAPRLQIEMGTESRRGGVLGPPAHSGTSASNRQNDGGYGGRVVGKSAAAARAGDDELRVRERKT